MRTTCSRGTRRRREPRLPPLGHVQECPPERERATAAAVVDFLQEVRPDPSAPRWGRSVRGWPGEIGWTSGGKGRIVDAKLDRRNRLALAASYKTRSPYTRGGVTCSKIEDRQ